MLAKMYSSVTHVEEIPRMDFMVPEIRLKIIQLNLNERGESLTPPPPAGGESSVLQRYVVRQPVVRKRLHKLESYNHLLHQLRQGWPVRCDKRLIGAPAEGLIPSRHCPESDRSAKGSPTEVHDKDHDDDPVIQFFAKGINRHTVSVAKREKLVLGKTETLPNKSTFNDIIFQSALVAMNELLDEGVLDISQQDMVQVGQCLTFSLFFHKTLLQLGKDAWHSTYAQVFRDAWMSFGCLGAMFLVSSMRR